MRRSAFALALGLVMQAPFLWAEDPPAIVALTLDTSGSIRPELIEQTRGLAVAILEALPAGSEVALFVFDDTSRIILPRTGDPEAVRQALQGVQQAGRFTALYDAVYDASRYLENAPRSRKAIILVTDGKDENSALQQEDGLKVATAARIPIFAVGVGRVQEAVLGRIAKLTSGEFTEMASARGSDIAARIAALEPSGALPISPPVSSAPRPTLPVTPSPTQSRVPVAVLALVAASVLLVLGASLILVLRLRPKPPAFRSAAPPPALSLGLGHGEGDEAPGATLFQRGPDLETIDRTMVLRTQAALRVKNGPVAGKVLELMSGRTVSIGRAASNDLQIADASISGEHCRVKSEDGAFVVYDVQSTNGTLVNGKQVDRHPLRPGDVITLGAVSVTFVRE